MQRGRANTPLFWSVLGTVVIADVITKAIAVGASACMIARSSCGLTWGTTDDGVGGSVELDEGNGCWPTSIS